MEANEIKASLNPMLKKNYDDLIENSQQIETGIGSAHYKIYKMCRMREKLEEEIRKWWDEVLKEYKLDAGKDYYVDNQGNVTQVGGTAPSPKPSPKKPDDADGIELLIDNVAEELK